MGIITDTILNTQESAIQPSKYDEALAKYDTNLDDNAVRDAVRKIIAEKVHENDTMEVKRFLFGSIELTSLKTTDSEESILAFTERVNDFDSHYPDLPHVATICVYPCFADIVAESLEVDGVEIACVSGSFPSSQARIEVKVAETSLAVADGATEIDIVMPVGKFLSGDYEGVCDEIQELKAACGLRPEHSRPQQTSRRLPSSPCTPEPTISRPPPANSNLPPHPKQHTSCVRPSRNTTMKRAYR